MPPGLEEGATGYEVTVRVIEVVIQAPSFTYQHTQDGYYVDYTLGVIWNGKKYYTVEWWEDSSVSVTADVIEGIGLPPEQCDRGSKTGFTTGTASAEWILEDSERKYTISGGRREIEDEAKAVHTSPDKTGKNDECTSDASNASAASDASDASDASSNLDI